MLAAAGLAIMFVGVFVSIWLVAAGALVLGVGLLLQVAAGPVRVVTMSRIAFDCTPLGSSKPTGARLKVIQEQKPPPQPPPPPVTIASWDFSCEGLVAAGREVERVKNGYCVDGDITTASATVEAVEIAPFFDTTQQLRSVRLESGLANGTFVFPCGPGPGGVDELIKALGQAFSGCCL